MTHFAQPFMLLLLVPLAILWLILLARSRSALRWLSAGVSPRFMGQLTLYGKKSFALHMLFLLAMGMLLVAAAAGPYRRATVEQTRAGGNIVLLVDASFSMEANDIFVHRPDQKGLDRFEQAKLFCLDLVDLLPDNRFGLVTFSGIAAVHSPPTNDLAALRSMIRYLTTHRYQATGSNFTRPLEALLHMMEKKPGAWQAVLLSDGEMPVKVDFDEELRLLDKNEVPVYTVGLGSREGVSMSLYDPRDIVSGSPSPSIGLTFFTRRDDANLSRIAKATGAAYFSTEERAWAKDLADRLKERESEPVKVQGPGKRDLSFYPVALFLALFLVETLLIAGRRPRGAAVLFAALAAATLSQCSALQADHFNEDGLDFQEEGKTKDARGLFEKSAAENFRREIPIYNLARNHFMEKDYAAAHDYYQKAIEIAPALEEAWFNDGHALYEWGRIELGRGALEGQDGKTVEDAGGKTPEDAEKACLEKCGTERTEKLWLSAIDRFEKAAGLSKKDTALHEEATKNAAYIKGQIRLLVRWFKSCVRRCDKEKKGGGGGDGEGGAEAPLPEKQEETKEQQEQEQIKKELERIEGRTSEKKYFNQSGAQQLPSAKEGQEKLPPAGDMYW
jgi:Ca-activated chloride channel family protein